MSKMGNTIVDIQELYASGKTIEAIVTITKTSKPFVEDVIKDFMRMYETENDYPDFVEGMDY